MYFCAAILILEMEEDTQLFLALCFIILRKVKMQLKQKDCWGLGESGIRGLNGNGKKTQ